MEGQAQKRGASSQNVLEGVKAVLLDIEGTTTPISFVHDKLFGYVRDNLKEYISTRYENEEVQADIEALREQAASDKAESVEGAVEIANKEEEQEKTVQSVVDNVLWQMDNDRKSASLKQLHGHMFRDAYKTGKVQGEVYEDVVEALKGFAAADTQVYAYSSASSDTQKLLFGYSDKGDLSENFSGFFDTTCGAKTEKKSYATIAGKMDVEAGQVLFLTDVSREAAPAAEAGMKVCLVERDGNTALTEEEQAQYNTISSFAELFESDEADEPPAKRMAPDAEPEESNGAAEEEEEGDELDEDEVDEEELGEEVDDDVVDEEGEEGEPEGEEAS